MRARKPRNAALEFAKAFTYLVAQEACRLGKGRTLDARKFEKWARATIRSAGGDPDKIGEVVGRKLHWLVYDQRRKWQMDIEVCIKRGRAFAWRHKVIIAEQVLAGEAEPPSPLVMSLKLGPIAGKVAVYQMKLYEEMLRRRREKKS